MVAPDVEALGSTLCVRCGACCGWVVLSGVPVRGEEIDWAKRKRLPLVERNGEAFFRLPCRVLRSEGEKRICGDYEHRPSRCVAFRCKLLRRFDAGEVTLVAALEVVRELRTKVEAIERCLQDRSGDIEAKLAGLRSGEDADMLLDLAVLRLLVRREILDIE